MHAIYNAEDGRLVGFVSGALAEQYRGHHRVLREDVLTDDTAAYVGRDPLPDVVRENALRYNSLLEGFNRDMR